MLRSETLFGKRDSKDANTSNSSASSSSSTSNSLSGTSVLSQSGAAKTASSLGNSMGSTTAATPSDTILSSASMSNITETGSKLTVGHNIKLKGVEITDCDTLVVEGKVEATTIDSRMILIAEGGAFMGAAEIDIAEIHGEFNGKLKVRKKLVIYSTGKVSGEVRYGKGKLVIEEGGELSGDVQVSDASENMLTRGLSAVAKGG